MPSSTFAAQTITDPQVTAAAQVSAAPTVVTPADQQPYLVIGERAFASQEDVKTQYTNSQSHIGTIEAENATLRTQLEEANRSVEVATSLEEVLRSKDETGNTALSQEQIETLVSNKVSSISETDLANANRTGCIAKARAAYGEDFMETMEKTAAELGLSIDDIDKMAGSNPRLFTRTFLPSGVPTTSTSSHTSTINTSNFQQSPTDDGIKPVLSLTSKERTAQLIKQLEALQT